MVLRCRTNNMHSVLLSVFVPRQLLPSPKEAVANPQPKQLQFGWWSSLVQLLPSLGANADKSKKNMLCADGMC